jgi:hypothetical protein
LRFPNNELNIAKGMARIMRHGKAKIIVRIPK